MLRHILRRIFVTLFLACALAMSHAQAGNSPQSSFDQLIDLPKGDDYLYLAAWDVTTGRLGILQVALDVSKPRKQSSN